jgi:hypothetical protein
VRLVSVKPKLVHIQKAGRPRSRDYPKLNKIADVMAGQVKASLVDGVRSFKTRTDVTRIARLLGERNPQGVIESIPWAKLDDDLTALKSVTVDGVARGAEAARELLPKVIRPQISFDRNNPRIQNYIQNHTGNLIVEITDSSRKAIVSVIQRGFDRGIPPIELGRQIRESIGLTERMAIAVDRYHVGLLEGGMNPGEAEDRMFTYASKLQAYRAETIARTESIDAVNAGQQEIWDQSIEEGIIKPSTKKVWVIDPGTACAICEPLEGQTVEIGEDFDTSLGPVEHPPVHPNCNCGMSLDLETI